jgi:putative Holliday junction resolvase
MTRYASIDVGLKRIGTAISLGGEVVLPQAPILRQNRNQAARDLKAFIHEWGIEVLVVGLPVGGSGEEEMKRRITHFVSLLDIDCQIIYQDEYGSSLEANERFCGRSKKQKDGKSDSIAASIILERYLAL